ncbi:MAG: M14 family zinc carboxypeptidase [Haloechinothrix sp.]
MKHPNGRRLAAIATTAAMGLAASLTVGAPAAAVEDDVPRTAFEESGGTAWTTLEEEQQFLAEVAAESDRVSVTELTTTPQGRPVNLIQIGEEQRSPEELAENSTALLLCLQHGNEPAGRESCLSTLRDLAFDDSRRTERLLKKSSVLVIPTLNPDGRAADQRRNSQSIDINRDHLALETREAQAVAQVLRDYDPDLVVDVHEYRGIPEVYDRDLIYLWPRNLNVDDQIHRESRRLSLDYTEDSVTEAGFSTGIYGIVNSDPPRQVAGNEDERIFRNMSGLRHGTSMLTETYVPQKDGETPTENRNRRVDSHIAALNGALNMLRERGPSLDALSDAAARLATAEGRAGKGPFYLGGADNDPATEEETIDEPPCSYLLTDGQYGEVARTLDLHGIAVSKRGDGVKVSMGQPARTVIPLLLDARADYHVVEATPVACG